MAKITRRTALATASAALAAPFIARSPLAQSRFTKPIKVAHLGDFSSQYAVYSGPVAEKCVRLAVADFQAKNPGIPVEVLVADHQNKPDIASSISQKWIDQDGVDAITDVPLSSCVFAVQDVVKSRNKLLLGSDGSSPRITNENCAINTVHWLFNTEATGKVAINAMFAQGAKTFFLLTVDNATGAGGAAAIRKLVAAKGGTVAGEVKHPFGVQDMSSFMLQAQQSKADVIVLNNAGPDVVNSIKTANEFKITQKLCTLQFSVNDYHAMGAKISQGLGYPDSWYWNLNAETAAFSMRVFKDHNAMPNAVQAATYSVVSHFLNAVKEVGTTDPTIVVPQMRKTKINDIYAKNATLREDGRLVRDMYFLRGRKPEDVKHPWDLLELVNTIPGAEAYPVSDSTCALLKKT